MDALDRYHRFRYNNEIVKELHGGGDEICHIIKNESRNISEGRRDFNCL